MRVVVQRVRRASVAVAGEVSGEVGCGLLVLAGFEEADTDADLDWMAQKLVKLRIFPDAAGAMNRSVAEIGGEILAVSQFTLYASTRKGNRPSWGRAARGEVSLPLFERFVARLGVEANDALDEFLRLALAFERDNGASLAAFLAMVATLELSIKRDMETAGDAVRVMTAHAAKGLEAKIVFLPDTCGAPAGRHDPRLYASGPGGAGPLLWTAGAKRDPAALSAAR